MSGTSFDGRVAQTSAAPIKSFNSSCMEALLHIPRCGAALNKVQTAAFSTIISVCQTASTLSIRSFQR